MRRRRALLTASFVVGFLAASLVTCARCCRADSLATEAGFRAALARLP